MYVEPGPDLKNVSHSFELVSRRFHATRATQLSLSRDRAGLWQEFRKPRSKIEAVPRGCGGGWRRFSPGETTVVLYELREVLSAETPAEFGGRPCRNAHFLPSVPFSTRDEHQAPGIFCAG